MELIRLINKHVKCNVILLTNPQGHMINHCLDVAHLLFSHMGTQVSFYACIQILYACMCINSRSKGMFWCAQHEHG